jgi:hypothetical protein
MPSKRSKKLLRPSVMHRLTCVAVTHGLQPHGAQLLRLEASQRLGGARGALDRHSALLGRRHVLGRMTVEVDVLVGDDGRPRPPHLHGLVLDHDVDPLVDRPRVEPVRAAEQELHAALVGVVRVIGAEAVAVGGPQQRLRLRRDRAQHHVLHLIVGEPDPSLWLGRRELVHLPSLHRP